MDKKKILQSDILDIIFDDRNKAYGAYELRRNYEKRARKAVAGMLLFALVTVSAPLLAGLLGGSHTVVLKPKDQPVIITKVHVPSTPQTPKPPTPPATPKALPRTTTDIPIVIARVDQVKPPIDDPKPVGPSGPSDPNGTNDPQPPGPIGKIDGPVTPQVAVIDVTPDPNTTYEVTDIQQWPEYPGGEDALMAYLAAHIKYPRRALENNVEGHVTLGFVIDKEGGIDDVKVLRGIGYGCDEEAMRVVNGMPKWKSGKNNGKPVRVYFNLPIVFSISE